MLLLLAMLVVAIGRWFQAAVKKTNHCYCFSLLCRGTVFFFFFTIVAAQPVGGKRWREPDSDTVSNDGERDQKESEVIVLLCYLFYFPLSSFRPLFFSLLFQKQSPRPLFFLFFLPSVPFLYFVSLSKLLSTSLKSPLFHFCFTLFSLSFFKILPPLYF